MNHKLSVITQNRSISISFSLYIHLSDWIIWKWDQKFKLSSLFWRWHHNHQQRTNFRFRDIRKPIKCTFYDLGTLIYTRQFWVLQVFLFFFSLRYYWFLERYFFFLRLRLLITHTNCSVKRRLFIVACGAGYISLAIFLVAIFWFFIRLFICLFISFLAAVDSL